MSSASALAELDRLLVEWEKRLERMDENLFALEEEPVYRTLIDPPTRARLSGETREVIERVAETLADLFVERDLLRQVVEEAREVRAEIGFFGDDAKVETIRRLLYGASIVLARRATTLTARTLLGSGAVEDRMTPSALVTRMASGFEKARRDIAEIGAAFREVESDLARLEEDGATLANEERWRAPDDVTVIADLRAAIARLRGTSLGDPLGARADVVATSTRLRELRVHLADESAQRAQADARLAQTGARLELLRQAPASARVLLDLETWRARLETTLREGRLRPAAIGLTRWHQTVDAELAALARRDELRGRLSARRAQVAALLARSAASAATSSTKEQLDELARIAASLLAEDPVPLDRLEEAIVGYERAIARLKA